MKAVCIAKIVGIHGLNGNLKLLSYAESLDAYKDYGPLYLRGKQGLDPEKTFKISYLQKYKRSFLLVRFEGVDSCDLAQELVGAELYVKRENLPEPEEGVYYWSDLVGLKVYSREGDRLGLVKRIIEDGRKGLFEIEGEGGEFLIPLDPVFVFDLCLEKGSLILDLPEGLLDL